MNCYHHRERESVARCNNCGCELCFECAGKISPPLCRNCAHSYSKSVKGEMVANIVVSIILMIIGIAVIESSSGILLAGIPYGWSILNKVTPSMFLWLSWIGWIVYFLIKLVLAYCIGLIALPIKIYKWVTELKKANSIMRAVDN